MSSSKFPSRYSFNISQISNSHISVTNSIAAGDSDAPNQPRPDRSHIQDSRSKDADGGQDPAIASAGSTLGAQGEEPRQNTQLISSVSSGSFNTHRNRARNAPQKLVMSGERNRVATFATPTTSHTKSSFYAQQPAAERSDPETACGSQTDFALRSLEHSPTFQRISNRAIYVALSLASDGEFHYILYIPFAKEKLLGWEWHFHQADETWTAPLKDMNHLLISQDLVLLYRVGELTSSNFETCNRELNLLDVNGCRGDRVSAPVDVNSMSSQEGQAPRDTQLVCSATELLYATSEARVKQALRTLEDGKILSTRGDLAYLLNNATYLATQLGPSFHNNGLSVVMD